MIRRSRSMITMSLSAAAVALAVAAPAQAATPFNAGVGSWPQVAVGADGVGHVVWVIDAEGDRVGYCRVPKNGTSCDRTEELSFPDARQAGSNSHPQVFAPAAGKVVIVGGCYGGCAGGYSALVRWSSTDNGASFGSAQEIVGDSDMALDGQGAYVDSGGGIAIGIAGDSILAAPTTRRQPLAVLTGHRESPSVVRVPGQNQLVAAASNFTAVAFSVFPKAPGNLNLTESNINTAENWSGAQPPTPPVNDSQPSLGAGGAGVFLAFYRSGSGDSSKNQIIVQRYDPAARAFGAINAVQVGGWFDEPDVAVDASGPHLIWETDYDGGRLRYRRSTDAGATYGPELNLALRDSFNDPQVAVTPDGSSGFVTWASTGSTIKVVPLDPQPEPGGGQPGGGQPGGGQPGGGQPGGDLQQPLTPKVYAGKAKRVFERDRNANFSLTVPRDCVQPGQRFDATLKAKRKKRKGNVFVKVARADFYLGSKRVKIDRKAPFVYRYSVRVTQPRGSTIKLRVRAFIKVRRGKAPKKSLHTTIRVCS